MFDVRTSNRVYKGINTPVITCDGFDYDTIKDRQQRLRDSINKMQRELEVFEEREELLMMEWQAVTGRSA